jgi:N utilization substance protein B
MSSLVDDSSGVEHNLPFAQLSRRQQRSLMFHLLYAVEAFDYQESVDAIVDNFNRGFDLDVPMDSNVVAMVQATVTEREILDELIKPFLLNWRLERIGVSTKLILRLALWELKETDTPANIVINEAIELAKCFAEKDAYKFINGLLDEAVKTLPVLQRERKELGSVVAVENDSDSDDIE